MEFELRALHLLDRPHSSILFALFSDRVLSFLLGLASDQDPLDPQLLSQMLLLKWSLEMVCIEIFILQRNGDTEE
jgi:hypothetical protein